MVTRSSNRNRALEEEYDFFNSRNSTDIYGRVIEKHGEFYDPKSGRIIRWKKHY